MGLYSFNICWMLLIQCWYIMKPAPWYLLHMHTTCTHHLWLLLMILECNSIGIFKSQSPDFLPWPSMAYIFGRSSMMSSCPYFVQDFRQQQLILSNRCDKCPRRVCRSNSYFYLGIFSFNKNLGHSERHPVSTMLRAPLGITARAVKGTALLMRAGWPNPIWGGVTPWNQAMLIFGRQTWWKTAG